MERERPRMSDSWNARDCEKLRGSLENMSSPKSEHRGEMSLSLASEIEKVEQLIQKHDSDEICLKNALTDCKSEIDQISLAMEKNPWLKAKFDSEPPPPPTLPPPSISFGNIHQEKKGILGINFEAGNFEEIETLENFIDVEEILEEIIRKMFPNSNAHKN